MVGIESCGYAAAFRATDAYDAHPARGLMQVKDYHYHRVPDADPMDGRGSIRLGVALLAEALGRHGNWWDAIKAEYFTGGDSGSGMGHDAYPKTVAALAEESGLGSVVLDFG